MNQVELQYLISKIHQPLVHFSIDYSCFYLDLWTSPVRKFLNDFNKLCPNLTFTYKSSRKNATFLDVNAKFLKGCISTDL